MIALPTPPASFAILKSFSTNLPYNTSIKTQWFKMIKGILFNTKQDDEIMHLNIDVKYAPSKAAICLIIRKHYLRKMEINCVVSVTQAKSVIC
jgi:hypothetical protein